LIIGLNTSFASFSDVTQETDYLDSINWMTENGIVQGYPDGSFKPNDCVNRAEFLKMLFKTLEIDTTQSTAELFPDTPEDAWYTPYVKTARERGVASGYEDGLFRPDRCVNRVEAVKMAIAEFYPGDIPKYLNFSVDVNDVFLRRWYTNSMAFAFSRDLLGMKHIEYLGRGEFNEPLTTGEFNYFPSDSISRGEVAEMLYRVKAYDYDMFNDEYELLGIEPVTDLENYPYAMEPLSEEELELLVEEFKMVDLFTRKNIQIFPPGHATGPWIENTQNYFLDKYGIIDKFTTSSDSTASREKKEQDELVLIAKDTLKSLSKFLGIQNSDNIEARWDKAGGFTDFTDGWMTFIGTEKSNGIGQQLIDGLEVVDTHIDISISEYGELSGIRGHWYSDIKVPKVANISSDEAIEILLNYADAEKFQHRGYGKGSAFFYSLPKLDRNLIIGSKLVVYPEMTERSTRFYLAWEIGYPYDLDESDEFVGYYMDAITGRLLGTIDYICYECLG